MGEVIAITVAFWLIVLGMLFVYAHLNGGPLNSSAVELVQAIEAERMEKHDG